MEIISDPTFLLFKWLLKHCYIFCLNLAVCVLQAGVQWGGGPPSPVSLPGLSATVLVRQLLLPVQRGILTGRGPARRVRRRDVSGQSGTYVRPRAGLPVLSSVPSQVPHRPERLLEVRPLAHWADWTTCNSSRYELSNKLINCIILLWQNCKVVSLQRITNL